jgi:type I restriction enzyme R subunit
MTEFKQIIGRGTRLLEDYGKTYFTIMDFRNASRLFADPEFDGKPEGVIDISGDEPVFEPIVGNPEDTDNSDESGVEETERDYNNDGFNENDKPKKYYVGDVCVKVISERVQYLDKGGKLITESLIDYTKKNILQQYARLDDFLKRWTEAQKKQAIIDEMKEEGVLLDAIRKETGKT